MADVIIEFRNIHKRFGGIHAVKRRKLFYRKRRSAYCSGRKWSWKVYSDEYVIWDLYAR